MRNTRPQVLYRALADLAAGRPAELPPGCETWADAAAELGKLAGRQGPGSRANALRVARQGLEAAEGAS